MEFDYSKLRGRIVEKYGDVRAFAKALELSETSTYNHLNNKTRFNQRSIEKWCNLLDIPIDGAAAYFFVAKV